MGNIYSSFGTYYNQYTDWNGNSVQRNPLEYRYSYDPYVVIKKKNDYQHAVYSDRLLQWDWDKHNELCLKHFGDEGQYWDNRSEEKIESFLRDYYGNQDLNLVGIMNGCNQGNGFPYWIFMFDCDLNHPNKSE